MKRLALFAFAVLFSAYYWIISVGLVQQAIALFITVALAIAVVVGPTPEPAPAPCPRCGQPARRLRVPAFARMSLQALVWVGQVVLLAVGLGIAFALDLPEEWLIAIVALPFAVYAGARGLLDLRLNAVDSARIHRCERCHYRFEKAAGGRAVNAPP